MYEASGRECFIQEHQLSLVWEVDKVVVGTSRKAACSMSSDLELEGIRIQIREKLNEEHVKLWLPPYCKEDGVTCEEEMQVRLMFSCLLWLHKGLKCQLILVYWIEDSRYKLHTLTFSIYMCYSDPLSRGAGWAIVPIAFCKVSFPPPPTCFRHLWVNAYTL
jgi:hypothetical protein